MAPELRVLAFVCAWLLTTAAEAQLFVCTDAKGRTYSGDRPPPECGERQVRELRGDGSVRRVIEPPLTPEQKATRAAEEKRQKEEAERKRETMRKDLALLEAYANELEIEETRNRALASRMAMVERAKNRIEEHQRERKKVDQEAEFYSKRELPERLKRSYQLIDSLVRSEEKIIVNATADMNRVNERFDNDLKRFRELVNAGAQPVNR
ncbi:MAG: DUF4124 domain-containing protein [Burkholderiales bacterium]|nr:DUF4124 domain-containing protein [Burkholderiales bacterium]